MHNRWFGDAGLIAYTLGGSPAVLGTPHLELRIERAAETTS
jgi:hypothetical protein